MTVQSAVSARGRPREERVDAAITGALRALLSEVGYAGLTMEAVAARARVGKATVYRRYRSKVDLVFANVIHPSTLQAPDTGSLRGDLDVLGRTIMADLGLPASRAAVPGLLADLADAPQLREHFYAVFIASERTVVADILDRAHGRGELDGSVDPDLVHAQLLGSIFAAIFLLDLPPSDELGTSLADLTTTALTTTALTTAASTTALTRTPIDARS